MDNPAFGLIIIGDEILIGQRQDRHFVHFKQLLSERGQVLSWCWLIPDEAETLTEHLRFSYTLKMPVFVCGGIGATPDDLTRGCAARAADLALERHPQAVSLIEERFGAKAYPQRIKMADLPAGATLIPNPHNQIPGFSLLSHYFLPGFPEMAWPMAEWVLDEFYGHPQPVIQEWSVRVLRAPESDLIPIMEELARLFPSLKIFSLPSIGEQSHVELGFRGHGDLEHVIQAMLKLLKERGIAYLQSAQP